MHLRRVTPATWGTLIRMFGTARLRRTVARQEVQKSEKALLGSSYSIRGCSPGP